VFHPRFLAVFFVPTLAVVLGAQVAQRWIHFAFANPARQVIYLKQTDLIGESP